MPGMGPGLPSTTVLVCVGPEGKPRSRIAGCITGSGRMCRGRSCRMPDIQQMIERKIEIKFASSYYMCYTATMSVGEITNIHNI